MGRTHSPPSPGSTGFLTWACPRGGRRRPVLKVNSIYGIYRAVQSGLGIGALPDYMDKEAGSLVEMLPELRGPHFDVYLAYPEELRDSKRIIVFRDFLLRQIADAGLSYGPGRGPAS